MWLELSPGALFLCVSVCPFVAPSPPFRYNLHTSPFPRSSCCQTEQLNICLTTRGGHAYIFFILLPQLRNLEEALLQLNIRNFIKKCCSAIMSACPQSQFFPGSSVEIQFRSSKLHIRNFFFCLYFCKKFVCVCLQYRLRWICPPLRRYLAWGTSNFSLLNGNGCEGAVVRRKKLKSPKLRWILFLVGGHPLY